MWGAAADPGGGKGYLLTGHHELLMPLIVWGVDAALARR